ncbi:MAG: TonB-dependent receptor domain-containing protein, partial [Bacteroidota bacterium]
EIGLPLDLILTRQNVGNGFSYVPVSSTSAPIANGNSVGGSSLTFADYYKGIQTNTAYYFMTDFNITNYLRFIGGVRNEINIMTINTVTQRDTSGNPLSFVQTKSEQNALFPSANLVYKLNQESNIRAAYSQTTARPDFREAVPLGYYDFVNFNNVIGNPNIKNTLIHNYDLRYEFFPKPQEVISVTVFYKNFIDPIEQNLTDDGSGNFIVAPVNLKSSQNLGFELDARKSLSFFRPTSKFFKDLYVYGNYSQMSSEVELATSLSDSVKKDTRRRPLQGLSPYSINLGLIYNGNKYGFNLVYNRFGRRLLFQGDFAFQDIYENPRDVVDIQLYARALRNKMEIKLNISDI